MDPLSITAGAIAVAQACKSISAALKILQDLSHVPGEIATLLDELYDFKNVLAAVCAVSNQRWAQRSDDHFSDGLRPLIGKAYNLLTAIASSCGIELPLVLDCGLKSTRNDGEAVSTDPRLDLLARFRWLRNKKKVDRYRERLRTIRLDIANHLATINLVDSFSLLSEVRDLTSAFRRLSIDQEELHRILATLYSPQVADNNRFVNTLDPVTATHEVETMGQWKDPFSVNRHGQIGCSPFPNGTRALSRSSSATWLGGEAHVTPSHVLSCLSTCSCSCHHVATTKTPAMLQSALGSWTLKLSGVPAFSTSCDEVACRRRPVSSVQLAYRLPPWLLSRVIHTAILSSWISGPQMSLTSTRIIPQSSEIFCQAIEGSVDGMKHLFSHGLASPFDASHNYGYTALHYAVEYGHLALCAFLLKAGARAEVMDLDDRTATDVAYHKICAPTTDEATRAQLQEVFDEDTWLEEKQFTVLHKIILELIQPPRSLQDELEVCTKAIDEPDSTGRTPLSWAAERADLNAVSVLLQHGALVNKRDNESNSPLHYACKAPAPDALVLLLEAAADPTARNKWSQTPLNYVSFFQNDLRFAEHLLRHPGVDIDDTDQHGVTAVANAAFSGHNRMLESLLDAGADIHRDADGGSWPLLDAISRNKHGSVEILLRRSRDCKLNFAYKDFAGETCLHYLARRADPKTVALFLAEMREGSIECSGLDTGLVGKDSLTPRDLVTLRGDLEVGKLLEELLVTIEREVVIERGSLNSDTVVFYDTFELLPQWEKDVGLKIPMANVVDFVG